MFEEQLDRIIAVAQRTGRRFHEMAGTAFAQPYREMRRLVAEGTIGEVVQVLAQKSYPWQPSRPQDENVDGGITRQVGVHALRMIEHVAGRRIEQIQAIETTRGDPHPNGQLRMASSMMARLEGGALASVVANYLNQKEGFGQWGNETLRIWGTKGFIETTDGGQRTRLIVGERDHGPLDASAPSLDYFDLVVDSILDEKPMPLTLEEELHPTRMVIRASMNAADEDGPR
jgi:predicted dehydrogenase